MNNFNFSNVHKSVVFRSLLFIVALIMLPFYACKYDNSIISPTESVGAQKPQKSFITVETAKAYFEAQVELLRREKASGIKVRTNEEAEATFDALDVIPQWDSAKIINNSAASFVEVSFNFPDGSKFSSSLSQNSQISPKIRSASALIISANSRGVHSASFMSVAADKDFLNNQGTLANFTYEHTPPQFKGTEMHYDIRGNFKKGWHFDQGKIDGTIGKGRIPPIASRCEWFNFCMELERYSIRVGNYVNTTIVVDCDNIDYVGFCNGWHNYEYSTGILGLEVNYWGGFVQAITMPTMYLEDKYWYVCSRNFAFTSINENTSIKQQAAISGLSARIDYRNELNESITLQPILPTLYISADFHNADGLLQFSHAQAASETAAIINYAEDQLRQEFLTQFERQHKIMTEQELATTWYNLISASFSGPHGGSGSSMAISKNLLVSNHTSLSIKPYRPCD